ncbi:flagellar M-ring protein FliF [Sphingomonas sp. IC-11]|nr:flagellar basal-body MS-ring/collar protein FliF [Sphingomonas sp. IC-11]MCD2317087.1 flagellar M-ring protein FliF [Sphingomonas sp. IC-11]
MIMGGVAVALLAVLAAVALRGGSSSMGFLYTDLDPAAAQSISEKLASQNIPFQLSADGSSILAPQDKLAELRMSMAGEKLGGKIGYDVLDEEEPFGISASRAKLNETRAIEGELSRSIESLQNVSRARVHIVMPEHTMFSTESRKATAAVTVKTRGRLTGEAVQSIRYLVSSSVPELAPEAVSIVDQTGALLARAGEAGEAGAGSADERQQAVEAKLREEIEALLEPIVGAGKVRAEVSAQIDRDQTREESNVFDPDKQVIARQVTVESNDQNSENQAAAQMATVGAQLPENQNQPGGQGDSRNAARTETSEDTTYANSQTRSVVVRAPGKINRLSVAVMIDGGVNGLPQPKIQRLTRLVENAVGIDAERGDSVVVESMQFAADDSMADKEEGIFSLVTTDQILSLVKLLVIAGVGLIALRMLKPKRVSADAPAAAAETLLTPQSPEIARLTAQAAQGDAAAIQQLEAIPDGSNGQSVQPAISATPSQEAAKVSLPAPAPTARLPEHEINARAGHIGHEMGVAIAKRITSGGEELTVRLSPGEFGKIEVRMAFDDGGILRAVVAAERTEALDLFPRSTSAA